MPKWCLLGHFGPIEIRSGTTTLEAPSLYGVIGLYHDRADALSTAWLSVAARAQCGDSDSGITRSRARNARNSPFPYRGQNRGTLRPSVPATPARARDQRVRGKTDDQHHAQAQRLGLASIGGRNRLRIRDDTQERGSTMTTAMIDHAFYGIATAELATRNIDDLRRDAYGKRSAERRNLEVRIKGLSELAELHDEMAERAERDAFEAGRDALVAEFGADYFCGSYDAEEANAVMAGDPWCARLRSHAQGHHENARDVRRQRQVLADALVVDWTFELLPPF